MAEAAGPAMAEMQPQRPAQRVRGRLGEWMHKTFTVEGRAEVMAQKQIDAILAQVPEEKRAEAMDILESRRGEFVEGKMEDAKGSLVRDAVIGAVVVGGVGAGIWKREWIGGKLKIGADAVGKRMPERVQKAVGGVGNRVNVLRNRLYERVVFERDRFRDAYEAGRRAARGGGKAPDMSNLLEALSGAMKLDALDTLDKAHPVTKLFEGNKTTLFASSELQNMEAEHFADNLVDLAKKFGRWVPMTFGKDTTPYGFHTPKGHSVEGMGLLIKKGLVTMKELTDGKKLFIPTEAFVGFVEKHLVS